MSRRVLAVAAAVIGAAVLQGQTPKWEVLSIRPTKACGFPGPGAGATKDGKKSGPEGAGLQGLSPGRLNNMCTTVANLLPQAYVFQASGGRASILQVMVPVPLEGAPGWLNSDLYQISAKAEGTPGWEMMMGR